jgi:hypothetical protein
MVMVANSMIEIAVQVARIVPPRFPCAPSETRRADLLRAFQFVGKVNWSQPRRGEMFFLYSQSRFIQTPKYGSCGDKPVPGHSAG